MLPRLVMLVALLPLLLPSGVVVTMCLETGAIGLRGPGEATCECCAPGAEEVPACCCTDGNQSVPSDPCCIELATVGEHPVQSAQDGALDVDHPAPESDVVMAAPAASRSMSPVPAAPRGAPPRFRVPLLI